jgi:uncharacterized membrane protein YhaH (DUF805 family)
VANPANWLRTPLSWLLLGLKGRISRGIYWLSYFFLMCVTAVLVGQLIGGEQASLFTVAQAIGPFVIIGTIYANLAISVKRLHDIGYSGFLALAMFIPLINFAFTIWVGIVPGTVGPNAYGEAPDRVPA